MKVDIKPEKNTKPLRVEDVQRKTWRRYHRLRVIGLLILVALLFIGSYWIIVSSELMRFGNLKVVGTNHLDEEDIRILLEYRIPARKPIPALLGYSHFWVWPNRWEGDDLKELPHIRSITFRPNYKERQLIVEVEERNFLGIWCTNPAGGADCLWFDKEGVGFEHALRPDGYLIFNVNDQSTSTKQLGGKMTKDEQFKHILIIEDMLRQTKASYRRLEILPTSEEAFVELRNGPTLQFSLNFPSRYAADVLSSLKRREIFSNLSYIDFRTQNKVFYK
ncbi:MAG: hypothetical protein KGZ30_02935 [Anaplasmataceae bacterium]|nr:hypothetical protein [Anaplasmataceae bacterium]